MHVRSVLTSRPLWTLADQGVVSIGNFLSGVIIANHLPRTGYGAYSLLLQTMLFLNSLQNAVVTYPMSVRGAKDIPTLRRIATASLWMTLAMVPILGLSMGLGVYFGSDPAINSGELITLTACAAAGMLLWQMQEVVRRALMAELRFMACVPGDAISYLGQVALLMAVASSGKLTLSLAFGIIGATSAVAMSVQAMQIGLLPMSFTEIAAKAVDFWKLGSWTLLAGLAGLPASIGYFWTLKIFCGLDATAAYAAMIVPTKLANPVLIAIGNLLVPTVARVAGQYGRRATIRFSVRYGLVGGALIFLYYGFLAAFPATALRMVFKSHSPYIAMAGPLRWYQIDLAAIYIESVLMAWLYGLGESRTNFTSQMVKASFILLVALPATAMFGLYGLIAGNLIAVSLCIAVQLYFLRKALRHQSAAESERVREFAGLLPALD